MTVEGMNEEKIIDKMTTDEMSVDKNDCRLGI
jgi:hypothetical protein